MANGLGVAVEGGIDHGWDNMPITDANGVVVERYSYSAYGVAAFLNPEFTPATNQEAFDWDVLYSGYKWDPESALYQIRFRYLHPVLGVWCSRDPIGYRDGSNAYMFLGSRVLNLLDPSGTIAIKAVGGKVWTPFSKKCVDSSTVAWKFSLSRTAGEICGGTAGILVQKVTISCSGQDCPGGGKPCDAKANPKTAEYWEAWYVPANSDTYALDDPANEPENLGRQKITDTSQLRAHGEQCGSYKATGEVRFYCKDITEPDWRKMGDDKKPSVDACFKDTFTSGNLPGWLTAPDFWTQSQGKDGVANRSHTRDWDCCPECSPLTDNADADPKLGNKK